MQHRWLRFAAIVVGVVTAPVAAQSTPETGTEVLQRMHEVHPRDFEWDGCLPSLGAILIRAPRIMPASLETAGLPADLVPMHPKMGALVRVASEMAAAVLAVKRGASSRRSFEPRSTSS